MNKNIISLKIKKKNWINQYKLAESIPNKKFNINAFLIHNISPVTNDYKYNVGDLTKRFNCSHATVYSALNYLKNNKYIAVKKHHIHFKNYQGMKGGNQNGK